MKKWHFHRLLRALAKALTLLAMTGAASARLISIDFEGQPSQLYSGSATTSGGLVPLAGQTGAWNALNLGATASPVTSGITSTRTASALKDGTGATTTISFEFNTGNAAFNSFDATNNIAITDKLGKDVAFIDAGSIAWRFNGLLANTSYDIRIFGQTDARPAEVPYNFADFTAGGLPVKTTKSSQNYVDFTVASNGSGVINGTFAKKSGTLYSSMSGIQIAGGDTTFDITATAGTGGSISPSGVTAVAQNSTPTYTITPATGYDVADVVLDGTTSLGAVTTYTFSPVTAAHTLSATFVAVSPVSTASKVISIDFEGQPSQLYSGSATTSGGLVPLAGQTGAWNALDLGATGSPVTFGITSTRTASALKDGTGATTSVSFAFNTGNAAFNSYDATTITVSDNLGKDVAYIGAGAIAWRFTGLQPNTSYDLRVFGQTDRNNLPSNFARFTVGATAITLTALRNYADFTTTSDGSGVINGTFAHSGSGVFASMSGIQIAPSFALTLSDFSYHPATGDSTVTIHGRPMTEYELVSSDDLSFAPEAKLLLAQEPTVLPGTITEAGAAILTDETGVAICQFNLGTGAPAMFARAQPYVAPPPPIDAFRAVVTSTDVETYSAAALSLRRWMVTNDPHYPKYHFVGPESWINDPNGPIYHNGQYHLFYQFDPIVNGLRSNRTWGHAVSTDLVHWKDWPVAIWPDTNYDVNGVYSGNTVVDDGKIKALYTGNVNGPSETYGMLAWSDDGGITFQKQMVMPNSARPNASSPVHWDGQVWKDGNQWFQLIGGTTGSQGAAFLWKSPDLVNWTLQKNIAPSIPYGTYWELPYLIELGGKHVLLAGAGGNPYWVGSYDAPSMIFTPDSSVPKSMENGNYYSFNVNMVDDKGPDGTARRLMHGWVTGAATPTPGVPWWQGAHSIPRVITINGDSVEQQPVPEIEVLRGTRQSLGRLTIPPGTNGHVPAVSGDALELIATFDRAASTATRLGLKVRVSDDKSQSIRIWYDPASDQFGVDGTVVGGASASGEITRDGSPGQPITLRVFLDRSIVETYCGGNALTSRSFADPAALGVDLFAEGGNAVLSSLEVWEMHSMWE